MSADRKRGNVLVDLIIGVIILGLVGASVGTAYSSLINRTTRAFEISKGAWMANSVMEIYTAKGFDDITSNNNFTLSQFPNYTADVSTANMDYNLSNGTLTEGDENSLYKQKNHFA